MNTFVKKIAPPAPKPLSFVAAVKSDGDNWKCALIGTKWDGWLEERSPDKQDHHKMSLMERGLIGRVECLP